MRRKERGKRNKDIAGKINFEKAFELVFQLRIYFLALIGGVYL